MIYRHYKGNIYKTIRPVRNEADGKTWWTYQDLQSNEVWVRPETEFEQKFNYYLPFGTLLQGDDKEFVVTHVGVDYYCLYCDDTAEELELKLLDVKRYYLLNHVVIQMDDPVNKIMYQFVLHLKG